MDKLLTYVQDTMGVAFYLENLPDAELRRLPIYLKNQYKLQKCELENKLFLLVVVIGEEYLPADQLKNQASVLQRQFGMPVIYVFDKIDFYLRKRLIQSKIAFIVPERQIYIPYLFVDLNEIDLVQEKKRATLRPASQCVLFYHLEIEPLEGMAMKDIAAKLNYSNMTITRAAQELKEKNICEIKGTKEKTLSFSSKKRELWEESLPYLSSPVKEKWYAEAIPQNEFLLKSGDTALATYSNLAESHRQTYAIGKDEFKALRSTGAFKELNTYFGHYILEIWHYSPNILSHQGTVDPLSLYVAMANDEDERVKISLDEMINKIRW